MDEHLFKVGTTFDCWESFKDALEQYSQIRHVQFACVMLVSTNSDGLTTWYVMCFNAMLSLQFEVCNWIVVPFFIVADAFPCMNYMHFFA